MSKSWYSIQASRTNAKASEIWIYGDIGESWSDETITAKKFVSDLAEVSSEELTVRINSVGGSVPDGLAIYNALARHPANVVVEIDGVAMSIASLIAMAGDEVRMAENAMMMVHAPWTVAVGNAVEMRELADTLDKWAGAMATSYASKTNRPAEEMLSLLTDGKDHYFTAAEALAQGFVDTVTDASLMAASATIPESALARYSRQPKTSAAAAAPQQENPQMPKDDINVTAGEGTGQTAPEAKGPDREEILASERARRTTIRSHFAPFASREGVEALLNEALDNPGVTAEQANAKLLAKLAESAAPVGQIVTVDDERDKMVRGAAAGILVRAGVADKETRAAAAASEHRGMKLLDLARASLERAGVRTMGKSQMEIVALAFTQSTSDFPVLLEEAMHKALLGAYRLAPDTWSRFCATGSVSDFRAHNRYRLGSIGNLDVVNEAGEFENKAIPDGEKAQISATTKGNIINLTRQAIINDDLGSFVGLAGMLGRAGRRTVEATVYALLAENAGLGPTMGDGNTLFHANHNNITTGAALSMAAIDADRVAMASQTDISGNDFLDLRPATLLVPLSLGGDARTINDAQYDPDTANKLQKPNSVRGLFRDVVDTPRLSGTRRYLFADANEAPTIEVAFLDGNQEPYVEQQQGFTVDGTQYKVRLDFGVAAVDYRGAVTNAGV